MKQKYAFQKFEKERMAKALGKDLPVSAKHSAMVCNAIKGKRVERARAILTDAIHMKKAIPFTRFNMDRGHKPKMGPGRFPVKTCHEILKLLNSAEANGHQKNLSNMHIVHSCAHAASKPMHFGRWRRREMKRSHIEIVLCEKEEEKRRKEKESGKEDKKATVEKKEEEQTEKEKSEEKQEKAESKTNNQQKEEKKSEKEEKKRDEETAK